MTNRQGAGTTRAVGEPSVVAAGPGVFAFVQPDGGWWINNAGIVVGSEATVVVDTCATEARSARLRVEVEARRLPGTRLVVANTHHHGDHTHGNCLFDDGLIVAPRGCRRLVELAAMAKYEQLFVQPAWGDLTLAPPTVEFSDSMELWLGDQVVELHACPTPAHTTADAVAWLPEQRVLFAGDLVFNGGTPFVAFGSVDGSIRALEWLRRFKPSVVVPGHGPLCAVSAFTVIEQYLRFLQQTAELALRVGRTPLEAARSASLRDFTTLSEPERIVGNLHRAMAEASGEAFDADQMVRDTLAYVGHPIACQA